MDSTFGDKVWSTLNSASRHHSDRIDCNDSTQLFEYLEANVTCLANFWNNVQTNMVKIKADSAKNVRLSKAQYEECKFRLDTYDYDSVLELANEAIVNCPSAESLLLSRLYLLRSLALYKLRKYPQALVNISTAVKLRRSPEYLVYMSKCLRRLDRHEEAFQCLRESMTGGGLCEDTPLSILDQRHHQEMVQQLHNSLQKDQQNLQSKDKAQTEGSAPGELDSIQTNPLSVEESSEVLPTCNFEIDYRCQLKEEHEVGRHFVANEQIKTGTLIFKEKSYSLVLLPEAMLKKCCFCYREVSNVFWPCTGCNEVVFCNELCAERASSQYHRFECGLAKYFLAKSKSTFHMFRFLARLGIGNILGLEHNCHLALPYNIDTYLNDPDQKNVPEFSKDIDSQLRAYKVKLSLMSHMDKFKAEHCPHQMVNAIDCTLLACLSQGLEFEKLGRQELLQLIDKTYVGIRRILINSFRWSEADSATGDKFNVATCLCLIGSLFNHSCDYNAEWMFENGVIYLTTVRDIKPGEGISICYGYDKSIAYEERQKQHLSYYFQCSCPACLTDASTRLALQCRSCPGPVLCNSAVYRAESRKEAVCLLCFEPYPSTQLCLQRLSRSRQEIDLISKLFNSGIDQTRFLEVLRQDLATVQQLAYNKSATLRTDIYKVCRILAQQSLLQECVKYGNLTDQLIPLYGEQDSSSSGSTSADRATWKQQVSSFDQEIDEMIFWVEVYKRYIAQELSPSTPKNESERVWNVLIRFYFRLFKLIKAVIGDRERKAKQNQHSEEASDQFESGAITEDVRLLNMLYQAKKGELQSLKQNHPSLALTK